MCRHIYDWNIVNCDVKQTIQLNSSEATGSWSPSPLIVSRTPSAFGPELAYRLRVAQPTLMDVPIFLIYFYITIYVCVPHFTTSPLWLRQGSSYSPNRLVSQSATLKEWSVQGCKRAKHKTYSLLDDLWVILSTSKAFHYFRARRDEIRFVFDPP